MAHYLWYYSEKYEIFAENISMLDTLKIALQVLKTKEVIIATVAMLLYANFVFYVAKYRKKPPKPRVKKVKAPPPAPTPPPKEKEEGEHEEKKEAPKEKKG